MQKTTLLQSIAQKNALFNSILKKSKNSKFITGIYTDAYNFLYCLGFFHPKKPRKAKKPKTIKKIPAMHLMQQSSDLIQRIYGRFGNEYSKEMYANRLLYSMTGDVQYIQKVVEMTKEGSLFLQQLRAAQNAGKKIFIFSEELNWWGTTLLRFFNDITFCGFVNNNLNLKTYKNLPVLSFEEYLQQKDNSVILIIHQNLYKTYYAQLKENGVKGEDIINFKEIQNKIYKSQYFDLPELRNAEKEHEIFVDCGCFDGFSSEQFAKWHGNKRGTVYAFEPDPQNKVVCEKRFAEISKQYTGGGIILPCFL